MKLQKSELEHAVFYDLSQENQRETGHQFDEHYVQNELKWQDIMSIQVFFSASYYWEVAQAQN